MPKTKWFELNDQRDAEGNLTKSALALEAISSWGCDCDDESEPCLSCLCEAALKELHEKVVGYEAEVKQLNSLLSANRLLTRVALGEMFQPDGVGIKIAKLEEERDEALVEVERLRHALQTIDNTGAPGGSIIAPRTDGHTCTWCRSMRTPCPIAVARIALDMKRSRK